jgi:competence protein ComGC
MSEFPQIKASKSGIVFWTVVAFLISILVLAIVVPNLIKAYAKPSTNSCINNLRWIDSAKSQWAVENNNTNGAFVTENDINSYLKHTIPKCPAGGTYIIGKIGENPTCSLGTNVIPWHVLQ